LPIKESQNYTPFVPFTGGVEGDMIRGRGRGGGWRMEGKWREWRVEDREWRIEDGGWKGNGGMEGGGWKGENSELQQRIEKRNEFSLLSSLF
jgi:hypothetical protein